MDDPKTTKELTERVLAVVYEALDKGYAEITGKNEKGEELINITEKGRERYRSLQDSPEKRYLRWLMANYDGPDEKYCPTVPKNVLEVFARMRDVIKETKRTPKNMSELAELVHGRIPDEIWQPLQGYLESEEVSEKALIDGLRPFLMETGLYENVTVTWHIDHYHLDFFPITARA